jgi:hypothetical protein
MTQRLVAFIPLVAVLFSQSRASAWSPTGHMVVGEIAKECLSNNAHARCSGLIPVKVPPQKVKVQEVATSRFHENNESRCSHD